MDGVVLEAYLSELFSGQDLDRTGKLQPAQLTKALSSSSLQLGSATVLDVAQAATVDLDGAIDYQHFVPVAARLLLQQHLSDAPEQLPDAPPTPQSALPPGWETGATPDGRTYYIDHTNGNTQWDPPASVNHAPDAAPGQLFDAPEDSFSDLPSVEAEVEVNCADPLDRDFEIWSAQSPPDESAAASNETREDAPKITSPEHEAMVQAEQDERAARHSPGPPSTAPPAAASEGTALHADAAAQGSSEAAADGGEAAAVDQSPDAPGQGVSSEPERSKDCLRLAWPYSHHWTKVEDEELTEYLMSVFYVADQNCDGVLQLDEFVQVIHQSGLDVPDKVILKVCVVRFFCF